MGLTYMRLTSLSPYCSSSSEPLRSTSHSRCPRWPTPTLARDRTSLAPHDIHLLAGPAPVLLPDLPGEHSSVLVDWVHQVVIGRCMLIPEGDAL